MLWRNEDFSTGKNETETKKINKIQKKKKNFHQSRVHKDRRYVVNVVSVYLNPDRVKVAPQRSSQRRFISAVV